MMTTLVIMMSPRELRRSPVERNDQLHSANQCLSL